VKIIGKSQARHQVSIGVLIAGVIAATVVLWPSMITRMTSYSFLPHGFCYLWNKQLLTLHVVSDSLIFLSYLAISCTITWLLYHERRRLPFTWIFVAFGAFIVACGFTHAMDVVVLWIPLYWLAGDIKFITAIASVITAIALPFLVPKIRGILKESASSRRNELRFLGVAETSLDCLYLADAVRDANGEIEDFAFTYMNDNAVQLVTFSREELIGAGMCELFPLNRKIGLFDRYKEVVRTGESFVGEFAIEEEQIKSSWLRIQAVKLGDGIAITASNITERKSQEEMLRASRNFLERTGRVAGIGGWELDIATSAVTWSGEIYRIHGVDPTYQPTLPDGLAFYAPEARPEIAAAVEEATGGGGGWDLELPLIRADGRRIWVHTVGEAEFVGEQPVRVVGAFQDVTERVTDRLALKTAYERLTLATESGNIGLWEWDIVNGTTTWDPLTYRMFGAELSDGPIDYSFVIRRIHPDDAPAAQAAILATLDRGETYNDEFRVVWPDGSIHSIHATGRVTRDEAGRALRLIGANWDISIRKENEVKLAKYAAFMHSIIASSPFATIVMDMQGMITSANPAAERMLWYRKEDLIDLETPLVLLNPEELAQRALALSEELHRFVPPGLDVLTANPSLGRVEETEWKLVRRDGSSFDAQLTVSALTGDKEGITGFILIAYDITERKRAQEYIAHLAHHDAMTGLPTRTLFRDRLDAALARAVRYQRKLGVLMVDLDNFKRVNDLMGHHVGDELLVVIAKRLQSCVRASDTVARMGGDEFTVILDELRSVDEAELVAERMIREITMPVSIGSHNIFPTASVGISVYPETGQSAEALVTNADAAMYQAKTGGRNGFQTYTRELAFRASRARQLEEGLSHALALKEFELVYQPQICMKTGMVSGVEALIRWRSGKLGMVMPSEFISLAEENGMIVPIGEWALRAACRQGRQLQLEMGRPLTIAVNISPRQFQQNNFAHMIGNILAESDLSPSSLELEITENILVGDLPRPKAILDEIRSLGVHVAIDDFGTGFSSMSYIMRFRVDRLKIDQSFIRDMAVNADSYAVTHAVIALARALHIPVVAEGVETAVHRDLLIEEGCDEAQGYFYSRPISMEGMCAAIRAIEHSEVAALLN